MSGPRLDADLAEAARRLTVACRVSADDDAQHYRAILRGRRELGEFFAAELGWTLEVQDVAGVVRLHKRRDDVPGDRGPYLVRQTNDGPLAAANVLVLVALICEQLWRRPRISLRELLQAVAQVCAAEAPSGRLPEFRIVATDQVSKREAQQNRQNIVDALKLLVAEGEISVDADLERAVTDEGADLFITADRESLSTKFASLSPTLLDLAARAPDTHAAVLSARSLPDADPALAEERAATVDARRLRALRRVVDDPAADPDDDPSTVGYLSTITGRERALNVVTAFGLVPTVRRDWWQVTDPSGTASGMEFPHGRRTERQAALAILAELPRRTDPHAPVLLAEMVALFESVRATLPRWAAAYAGRLPALARAAATELVAAGLLRPSTKPMDCWRPTPGVHLWRVRVRHAEPTTRGSAAGTRARQPVPRLPDTSAPEEQS